MYDSINRTLQFNWPNLSYLLFDINSLKNKPLSQSINGVVGEQYKIENNIYI